MLMLLGAFCLFSDQVSITPYESEREEGGNGTSLEYVSRRRRRRGELDQPRQSIGHPAELVVPHIAYAPPTPVANGAAERRARVDDGGDIQKGTREVREEGHQPRRQIKSLHPL